MTNTVSSVNLPNINPQKSGSHLFLARRTVSAVIPNMDQLSPTARAVLPWAILWLGSGLHPKVAPDSFRLAVSTLVKLTGRTKNAISAARKELTDLGVFVCTDSGNMHVPPTYRIVPSAIQAATDKTNTGVQKATPRGANDYRQGSKRLPPRGPNGYHSVSSDDLVPVSSTEESAASPRAPSALSFQVEAGGTLVDLVEGSELTTTEELESVESPVHLATTVQEGPTGSPGPRVPGRLSAGAHSTWVPEEAPESSVRPKLGKKSPGKKNPKAAPVPLAARAALEAPPALPKTSERVAPRPATSVASRPLPARTQKATPDAAPAPRTIPALPEPVRVWRSTGEPPPPVKHTPEERAFVDRYNRARDAVRFKRDDMLRDLALNTDEGCAALGDFCAHTFAENFPRGWHVEAEEFLAARAITVTAARSAWERAEANRAAREAKEDAEEEARAERAHKKKRTA